MMHVTLAAALTAEPTPGSLAATMAQFPGAILEFYAPIERDLQAPHARDEIYVIARGVGTLRIDGAPHAFAAGDVFYVPAHTRHLFTDFSADFGTWVLFYGPEVP